VAGGWFISGGLADCAADRKMMGVVALAMDFAMIQPKLRNIVCVRSGRGFNCFEHAGLLLL
jgi:hypothetical protein